MPLIDTHAHLFDDRFAADLPATLARAVAAGVERVLAVGIDLPTSRASLGLADGNPLLFAAVGIQPNHVAEAAAGDWDAVAALAESSPKIVALGETGLDRYWDRAPFELQVDYFVRHLELAHRLKKPVVIHCREAEADVVRVLRERFDRFGPVAGVMHSYCGDAESAQLCLEMGLHVSFAGMLTYKTGEAVRAVAKLIPANRLLVETDCPYLAPVPVRGKRNEPAFVAHTAACLADLRGVPREEIERLTTANARALFQLPPA
ncbi:TatD family hydrolase [Limnoglobus roseus]|uniref:TatD family deoxyribonuclease n=1 Tax=Limnoglobus roseus TaxID=2598579 RepID=A0A5C1AIV0_9BACT|nr:TatD family hydrolase [Limnoglobus roseus]QEL16898.1 TatD family deoxyribonuclease [Limnoglobus roseus]